MLHHMFIVRVVVLLFCAFIVSITPLLCISLLKFVSHVCLPYYTTLKLKALTLKLQDAPVVIVNMLHAA